MTNNDLETALLRELEADISTVRTGRHGRQSLSAVLQ